MIKPNEPIEITVYRRETNFDRACNEAAMMASARFGLDDDGHFLNVENSERTTDAMAVKFIDYTLRGSDNTYTFSAWITRTEEEDRIVNKPKGKFKCRACHRAWDGSELYQDPNSTVILWTCGYLACGALVDKVKATVAQVHEQDWATLGHMQGLAEAWSWDEVVENEDRIERLLQLFCLLSPSFREMIFTRHADNIVFRLDVSFLRKVETLLIEKGLLPLYSG